MLACVAAAATVAYVSGTRPFSTVLIILGESGFRVTCVCSRSLQAVVNPFWEEQHLRALQQLSCRFLALYLLWRSLFRLAKIPGNSAQPLHLEAVDDTNARETLLSRVLQIPR